MTASQLSHPAKKHAMTPSPRYSYAVRTQNSEARPLPRSSNNLSWHVGGSPTSQFTGTGFLDRKVASSAAKRVHISASVSFLARRLVKLPAHWRNTLPADSRH